MEGIVTDESTCAFTVAQFCHRYQIGRTRFYEEVNSGRLPLRKLGRKTLVTKTDAENWLLSLPLVPVREVA
jgi:hypothetical protein